VERRFAWFKRTLKTVDERFNDVFPPEWRVQHCLLMAFLQQTRQDILHIMEGEHGRDRLAKEARMLTGLLAQGAGRRARMSR
jgi:hypothetical protein